jgi:hypothetical protein
MRNGLAALLCFLALFAGCGKSEPQVVEHKHTLEVKGLDWSPSDDWLKGLSKADAKEAKENWIAADAESDRLMNESDSLNHKDFMALDKSVSWAWDEFFRRKVSEPLEASRWIRKQFEGSAKDLISAHAKAGEVNADN